MGFCRRRDVSGAPTDSMTSDSEVPPSVTDVGTSPANVSSDRLTHPSSVIVTYHFLRPGSNPESGGHAGAPAPPPHIAVHDTTTDRCSGQPPSVDGGQYTVQF